MDELQRKLGVKDEKIFNDVLGILYDTLPDDWVCIELEQYLTDHKPISSQASEYILKHEEAILKLYNSLLEDEEEEAERIFNPKGF